jgi:hypothetical protein
MRTTKQMIAEMTEDEKNALSSFYIQHGRKWKSVLRDEWMSASGIGPIHNMRNKYGPAWLVMVRTGDFLPKG